ncbi:glycosyltransferase [Deinococcus altitudinis]|uniref:glycosyltransferase n=1 Tax=Deinococcus altitudinis TaxID=468914 RepID=UPI0038926709
MWSPANTGPLLKRRQVVTIHDVATLDHPEWFERKFALWYRWMTPRLVRRARQVLTVSEYSKARIVHHTGVSADRVTAIPLAADERFRPHSPEECRVVREQLGLPTQFVLSVGSLEPRKNLGALLSAWQQWTDRPPELVLAISGSANKVFSALNLSAEPDGVRFLGRVPDEQLPALYSAAEAFVYPSFYEGFGLPPLEAMASGTAVITSGTTSLPEVVGEAALTVNPHDPQSITAALRLLFAGPEKRETLARQGLDRAARFSWQRTAEETARVLHAQLGAGQPGDRNTGSARQVFVHLAEGQDAVRWRARYERGEVPDAVPYGYHHAESETLKLAYSSDAPESGAGRLIRKGLTRLLGFDLIHAWRHREQFRQADVVWTHTEREHLAVAAVLQTMSARERPRLLAQSVWLMDRWDSLGTAKQVLYRLLLGTADVLTFHSGVNAQRARALKLNTDIRVVPFGISTDSFPVRPVQQGREPSGVLNLLALGNDMHRDWPILLAAVAGEPTRQLRVLTAKLSPASSTANVQIGAAKSHAEIVSAYEAADVVAVPLTANQHASGFTVVLEAVQMGKPVVVTRTGGLDAYFGDDDVTFVPVGDEAAWRAAVADIAAHYGHYLDKAVHAQRTVAEKELTTAGYAARHARITEGLLSGRKE